MMPPPRPRGLASALLTAPPPPEQMAREREHLEAAVRFLDDMERHCRELIPIVEYFGEERENASYFALILRLISIARGKHEQGREFWDEIQEIKDAQLGLWLHSFAAVRYALEDRARLKRAGQVGGQDRQRIGRENQQTVRQLAKHIVRLESRHTYQTIRDTIAKKTGLTRKTVSKHFPESLHLTFLAQIKK